MRTASLVCLFGLLYAEWATRVYADVRRATVRIVGTDHFLAGTVIHASKRYGTFALTCRHGLHDQERWQWDVNGQTYAGRWRVISNDSDLALVWDHRWNLAPKVAPVASRGVEDGSEALSLGFDVRLSSGGFSRFGGKSVRWWTAKITKVGSVSEDENGSIVWLEALIASKQAGPGRSGGGLFNRQGHLIGVCSQARGYGATFVGHSTVVSFLNRCHARGYVPWWQPLEPDIAYATEQIVEHYIGKGDSARRDEHFSDAIARYTAAIELDAELAGFRAYFRRGILLRELGHHGKALADLRVALEFDPGSVSCQIICGNVLYNLREYNLAVARYDAALRLDPRCSVAFYNRGSAHSMLKQYDLAVHDYYQAAAHTEGDKRVYVKTLADALTRRAAESAQALTSHSVGFLKHSIGGLQAK